MTKDTQGIQKTVNRNATNYNKLEEYKKRTESTRLFDRQLLERRIQDNLLAWELMTKRKGLPYNPKIAESIKSNFPTRLLVSLKSLEENEKIGYWIAKHLINSGVAPSKVAITTLEQCYLSVRGFGDATETKKNIFNRENQLVIIENVREIRNTDIVQNVYSFWEEFIVYLIQNPSVHALLLFERPMEDGGKRMNWYPVKQGEKVNETLARVKFRKI